MMRARTVVQPLLVILLLAQVGFAQAAKSAPGKRSLVAQIEGVGRQMLTEKKVPGMTVSVSFAGRALYDGALGLADVENNLPMKPTAVSRIGSVSKPITAVAVMMLEKDGKLSLDDSVQKHCAAFPDKQWPVTVKQVLSHLGGIRHYKSAAEFLNTKRYTTVNDALAIFKDDPLIHEPGSKYFYSSWGYNLLGCVVEGASAMTYPQYVSSRILAPLKLSSTRTEDVSAIVPNRVRYYSENRDGTIGNAFPGDMSDRLGGGGWLSSAADIRTFGEALAQGKLISPVDLNRMTTAATSSDGKAIPYGLGVTPIEFDGRKAFFHTGDSLGASAILYVEGDVVIAAIWNKDSLGGARLQFAKDVAALVAAQKRK